MKPLFEKKDIAAVAVILLTALSLFMIPKLIRPKGAEASVIYDGNEVMRISLEEEGIYHVEGELAATLEVKDGKIRFINSICPDKLCEGFGWIGLSGETAVCMPAKLAVVIL